MIGPVEIKRDRGAYSVPGFKFNCRHCGGMLAFLPFKTYANKDMPVADEVVAHDVACQVCGGEDKVGYVLETKGWFGNFSRSA